MSPGQKAECHDVVSMAELAGAFYDQGNSCVRSILLATGNPGEELLAAAAGFSCGIGKSGCLCGAITGGVMVLGLNGQGKRSAELVSAFKEVFQTSCCRSLSRDFIWMSEEHQANCRRLTVGAAAMVEAMLQE